MGSCGNSHSESPGIDVKLSEHLEKTELIWCFLEHERKG